MKKFLELFLGSHTLSERKKEKTKKKRMRPLYMYFILNGKIVRIHMSNHRPLYKCNNTLVTMVTRSLVKI